jgi:lipopolysaccharide export system permease protein
VEWSKCVETIQMYRQINNEFLYVNSFNQYLAFNFALENFKKKLVSKITASRIKWNHGRQYLHHVWFTRTIGAVGDKIEKLPQKTLKFSFDLEDLTPVIYIAETLSLDKLYDFMKGKEKRGSSNINMVVVLYKI